MPLEEAAQQFDSAYRLLLTTPPDDVSTPNGPVHVVERHSCAYGARRFGHVILQYRGRVVSLLMTANGGATGPAARADVIPHVIGRPMNGLSVVSVNGSRHAVVLVSDLGNAEMTQLSQMMSLPLAQRLEGAIALSSGLAPVGLQRGFPIPIFEWTCLAILAGHANDAYARCA